MGNPFTATCMVPERPPLPTSTSPEATACMRCTRLGKLMISASMPSALRYFGIRKAALVVVVKAEPILTFCMAWPSAARGTMAGAASVAASSVRREIMRRSPVAAGAADAAEIGARGRGVGRGGGDPATVGAVGWHCEPAAKQSPSSGARYFMNTTAVAWPGGWGHVHRAASGSILSWAGWLAMALIGTIAQRQPAMVSAPAPRRSRGGSPGPHQRHTRPRAANGGVRELPTTGRPMRDHLRRSPGGA